jgi:hypothetical protein
MNYKILILIKSYDNFLYKNQIYKYDIIIKII